MTVLASINLSEVDDFKGKGKGFRLIPTTSKDGSIGKSKKEFFFLNLDVSPEEVGDLLEVLATLNPEKSIIKTVTITSDCFNDLVIPKTWHGRVFLKGVTEHEGVINLVHMGGVPNLKELQGYAKEKENLRFVGGTILEIPGIPVGRFDEGVAKDFGILGKDEANIYHKEGSNSYDFFEEMLYSELMAEWSDFEIVLEDSAKAKLPKISKPKIKVKKEKKAPKTKTAEPKEPKKPKVRVNAKKDTFSKIFSEKVEF